MPAGWISAGVAVAGAVQNIQANKAAAGTRAANNQIAQENAGAQGTMLNKAQDIANQPFTPYTGTLTAPMSGNQQQAYDLASSSANSGEGQALVEKGAGLVDQVAGNGWNADTAAKYMNPYTDAVTNNAIEASNKNYLQNLTSLNENAAQSGAFGGARNAIAEGELAGQNQLNIGNITAQGKANAWDAGIRAWQSDNQTKLAAANAYDQAGGDITKMTSDQITNLMKTGGVSQVIAQTGLDAQYNQFMRQQNWSANQLQPLLQAMGRTQGGVTQQTPVQSNTANQLLGLASTVAGLFKSNSTAGSTSSPADAAATGAGSALNDPNAFWSTGGVTATNPIDGSALSGNG